MGTRLVILGATGRLGRMVCKGLPRGITALPQARSPLTGHLHWDPTAGRESLKAVLAGADAVLNLIGTTPTSRGEAADYEWVNRDLSLEIVAAARGAGVGRVMMVSSGAVYGRPADPMRPFVEADSLAPMSDYGRSKQSMEAALSKISGADLTVLRVGNVAGADALLGQLMGAEGTVEIMLDQFPNGHGPRRSYIGPSGLASVIGALAVVPRDLPPYLNISAPPPLAMADLLESWAARRPGTLVWRWRSAPAGALPQVALSHDLLTETLGSIEPVTAEAIVDETIAWEGLA